MNKEKTLGSFLFQRRKALKLTRAEVVARMPEGTRVDQSMLRNYENGTSRPHLDKYEGLATALDMSTEQLLFEAGILTGGTAISDDEMRILRLLRTGNVEDVLREIVKYLEGQGRPIPANEL